MIDMKIEEIEKLCYEFYEKIGTEKTVEIKIKSKDISTKDEYRLGNLTIQTKKMK